VNKEQTLAVVNASSSRAIMSTTSGDSTFLPPRPRARLSTPPRPVSHQTMQHISHSSIHPSATRPGRGDNGSNGMAQAWPPQSLQSVETLRAGAGGGGSGADLVSESTSYAETVQSGGQYARVARAHAPAAARSPLALSKSPRQSAAVSHAAAYSDCPSAAGQMHCRAPPAQPRSRRAAADVDPAARRLASEARSKKEV